MYKKGTTRGLDKKAIRHTTAILTSLVIVLFSSLSIPKILDILA
jgi:hypothetical protein